MEKQLSDLTTVELKALAYDQMAQIEFAQNNLRAINQELSKRLNASSNMQQAVNSKQQPQNHPIDPLPPGSIQVV